MQQRERAGNVLVDPLALDERDREIERAVGAAALGRLFVERVGRLEILRRVVARFEQQAETDHRADVARVGGLAIEGEGFVVAAGGVGRAGEQSLVVRDFRMRRRRLTAEFDRGFGVLLQERPSRRRSRWRSRHADGWRGARRRAPATTTPAPPPRRLAISAFASSTCAPFG